MRMKRMDFGSVIKLALIDLDISRLDADDFAFETPEPPMAELFEEVHESLSDLSDFEALI
ncbi:MAG: hypothetical protein ABJN69_11000 [Hellea sp.]